MAAKLTSQVVVLGCGIAGLSAALSAAQEGAQVTVLERSPRSERGGNSRYTSGNVRMKDALERPSELADRLMEASDWFVHHAFGELTLKPYADWPPILRAYGFTDPELVTAFLDGATVSIAWLRSCGVRLEPSINPANGGRILETVGGGHDAVETLAELGESLGVTFHYETSGRSLIIDDNGTVAGVRAASRKGYVDIAASAVILASGGFEGNSEMCSRYLGPDAYRLRTVCPGGMYNKGEGIEMALRIGAAPAGQFDMFHSMICDPRSTQHESIKPWNYGVLVNINGDRFIDEGSDARERIAHHVAEAILHQPEGKAYFIYDDKLEDVPHHQQQLGSEVAPIVASSLGELAEKLDVPADALRRTIDDFNAGVRDGVFTPIAPDGLSTVGVAPPKSNWARRIDGPRLMAYPVVCTNVFTFGGLRVSPNAQVVDSDGYEIPGLYAAGEVIGFYYGSYLGGTSYLRGLVFGRIAGVHAARSVVASTAGPP